MICKCTYKPTRSSFNSYIILNVDIIFETQKIFFFLLNRHHLSANIKFNLRLCDQKFAHILPYHSKAFKHSSKFNFKWDEKSFFIIRYIEYSFRRDMYADGKMSFLFNVSLWGIPSNVCSEKLDQHLFLVRSL